MRSIWKGYIQFSLVTIPIRIYNAVDTLETIRFNQLHKEDNGAIGYEKKCKKCGKAVKSEEICKGYEFEPEKFIPFANLLRLHRLSAFLALLLIPDRSVVLLVQLVETDRLKRVDRVVNSDRYRHQ